MQGWKSCLLRALPHIAALAVFAALSALFFAPQYSGKALRQSDMVQVSGMSRDIQEHVERYGEHPGWTGGMFGGMPSTLVSMDFDGRLIKQIADRTYFLGQPAAWLFIAMSSFYLMLVMFGVNPWLGIIGGIAYGLSSYFVIIIGAGHVTKMMALAWVPAMVGSVWYAYRRRMWLGAALTGIFASIEISTSHLQIPYYFLFVLLALAINEFVIAYKEKMLARFGKTTALLLLAGVLAVGSNFIQLYYVTDYAEDSIRGRSELTEATVEDAANLTGGLDRDYITAWSYGKLETLNLLVPNLYGGGRDFSEEGEVARSLRKYQVPRDYYSYLPSYWGDQPFTDGPVYLGASVIFLCVLGLFWLRGREKWWILAVTLLAVMLAWGRHFMWLTDLFLDYFPYYDKFRVVSTFLVVVEWSVPLLGVLALQRLWNGQIEADRVNKGFKWSLILVGGLCLLVGIFGPMFSSFVGNADGGMPDDIALAMQNERASLMRVDAFRSLLFVGLSAGMIWLFVKNKIRRGWLAAGVGLIVLLDLFTVDKRYVNGSDFRPQREALAIEMTAADRIILQDTTNYRVANFSASPFQDATTSYYHRSIGGYHAAKMRRYQELIEHHLSQSNMAVYDMLNTKYFIVSGEEGQPQVQANPQACGNAWFVEQIGFVNNADQEIAALGAGFDPHTTAIVDRRFESQLSGVNLAADSTASVQLTDYRVNRLTYRTRAAREGVVVFSEIYYPKGWTAYIDGEPAEHVRADYVLRAMRVPAGEHTIEFRYAPQHYALLADITRTSSLILIFGTLGLLAGGAIRKHRRKNLNSLNE